MTWRRILFALAPLGFLVLGGAPDCLAAAPEAIELAQAQPAATPSPTAQAPGTSAPAPDAQATADEPIGNVATMTGVATVIRNKNSIALKLRDDVYLNDVVQTAADSALSITFNDATTLNLSASARITIDNYVYEDGGKQNAAIFDIGKGTIAFVAAAVAKTGDMKITTPTATLGIRGTTGVVDVPEGTAGGGTRNVNIKLYPDADGRVGHIEVNDRNGARLGSLTRAASGFAIQRGAGGVRLAAVPLTISPQEARRDQGFVRQVHAAQTVGRQIVSEQRAFRRANPGLNHNQPQRPAQPPQRQNGLPGSNRPGLQQPTSPDRQGIKPQRQGGGSQPGAQPSGQGAKPGGLPTGAKPVGPHSGQNGQPAGAAPQPALQPRQGGVQRLPGLPRPAPVKPRPVPPKQKKEKR